MARGRARTVLVMWEYGCDHSPVWSRGDDVDVGPIDVRVLGVDDALRDDLADWNARCVTAADPGDLLPEAMPLPLGEAFPLAARLQRALGDAWTVWCLSGDGDGGLRDAGFLRWFGQPYLLRRSGFERWTPGGSSPALDRLGRRLQEDVHDWVASADRLPPAEMRATALELAGRILTAMPEARVLWFGGDDVPA